MIDMRFILLMAMVLIVSCKPDTGTKSTDTEATAQEGAEVSKEVGESAMTPDANGQNGKIAAQAEKIQSAGQPKTNFNKEGIPDACDLLSVETIAKYVNQPSNSIFAADGSSPQNLKARACFFKWDGSAIPNAGVMVQLQRNPVQEEVPEYLTYLISSKKTEGDNDPVTKSVIKYKDWPGFGDDGAYSTEAGKYVWRVGSDWAFMIAFNTDLPPNAQKVAADAFAREVMSKMTF
jgi:hypothetical protein